MRLATSTATSSIIYRFLLSRRQYRTCRIRVPDLQQSLGAVQVGKDYYSYFKAVNDGQQLLTKILQLGQRGDRTVITQSPKGYIIWVREHEATPVGQVKGSPGQMPAPSRILTAHDDYSPCNIYVPGCKKERLAIRVNHRFYSLFKLEGNFENAIQVSGRLSRQGNETIIVKPKCILEKVSRYLDDDTRDAINDGFVVCMREHMACLAATA